MRRRIRMCQRQDTPQRYAAMVVCADGFLGGGANELCCDILVSLRHISAVRDRWRSTMNLSFSSTRVSYKAHVAESAMAEPERIPHRKLHTKTVSMVGLGCSSFSTFFLPDDDPDRAYLTDEVRGSSNVQGSAGFFQICSLTLSFVAVAACIVSHEGSPKSCRVDQHNSLCYQPSRHYSPRYGAVVWSWRIRASYRLGPS